MNSECGSANPVYVPKYHQEQECSHSNNSEMGGYSAMYGSSGQYKQPVDGFAIAMFIVFAVIILTAFIWLMLWSYKPSFVLSQSGEVNTKTIATWSLIIAIIIAFLFFLIKYFSR